MIKRNAALNRFRWILIAAVSILLAAIIFTWGRSVLGRFSPAGESSAVDPAAAVPTSSPDPWPYAAFVDQFASANPGVVLKLTDQRQAPAPFAAELAQFELNGAKIIVYIYPDSGARQLISDRIAPDGGSYGEIDSTGAYLVTKFDLTDYPHFWAWERYLIDYVGHDGAAIDALTNAFGSQFAAGAAYASSMELLTAQAWVLNGWGTPAIITGVIPAITWVRFADGQMSGSTGANDFSVPFVLNEEQPDANFRLALDQFAMTAAVSGDPAVDQQEQLFVAALRAASHIAVAPDSMTISYGGDGFFLMFASDAAATAAAGPAAVVTAQPALSSPQRLDFAAYFDQLAVSLRDPDLASDLRSSMAAAFGYGCWRCEWQTLTPEQALPSILSFFAPMGNFTTQVLPDEPAALLDGQNPYQMLGPDAAPSAVLFVQGLDGPKSAQALLWFTAWDDRPVWQAILVAPEGFQ